MALAVLGSDVAEPPLAHATLTDSPGASLSECRWSVAWKNSRGVKTPVTWDTPSQGPETTPGLRAPRWRLLAWTCRWPRRWWSGGVWGGGVRDPAAGAGGCVGRGRRRGCRVGRGGTGSRAGCSTRSSRARAACRSSRRGSWPGGAAGTAACASPGFLETRLLDSGRLADSDGYRGCPPASIGRSSAAEVKAGRRPPAGLGLEVS